mmetsp:Transcript_75899/g.143064  ORF Transcript_75899/g.143064 Transcript_75899/m.143064 type:complete len:661 (-) Transcript_75899:71-2053(-)
MSSTKVSDEEHAADDSAAAAEKAARDETRIVACLSCCGILGIGALIGLIILLCSIHHLGPEDQVVISGPTGKYVRNGPSTVVLGPERKKVWRQPIKLMYMEYARVKNTRTGAVHHEAGPKFLFLDAYEVIERKQRITVLQQQQYLRLIDQLTGSERVLLGPQSVIPGPFETAPDGVQKAVVVSKDTSLVVNDTLSGVLRLETQEGLYYPKAYEFVVEVRNATLLGLLEYAIIKDDTAGTQRVESGPKLLHIGAYERILQIKPKLVLRKDEYIRLVDKKTGVERVERGPQTFSPKASEESELGIEQVKLIDTDSAVLVLDKATGQQELIKAKSAFFPQPLQEILEIRSLTRLLPWESVAARNALGEFAIFDGITMPAFFLPAYWTLFEMQWTSYSSDPGNALLARQRFTKVSVTKVDRRARKLKFWYDVRTGDNVELRLGGVVFWQVQDFGKMVTATADPESDVWHHARSSLVQAVSRATFNGFMNYLDNITDQAFQELRTDGFYDARGVHLESLELTSYDCVRNSTAKILEQIIQESTNRVNRLQKQESLNEVNAANLTANIIRERQRTQLIITRATNSLLEAEMIGDVEGLRRLSYAQTFIGGLMDSVPDIESRVELYKMHQKLQAQNNVTQILASSDAALFLKKEDLGVTLAYRGSEL